MHAPSRRRWFRFSLRTALIGVAVLSLAGGYVAHEWRITRERSVFVEMSWENREFKVGLEPSAENRLPLMRRLFGNESVRRVILPTSSTPELQERARKAFPESTVEIVDFGY